MVGLKYQPECPGGMITPTVDGLSQNAAKLMIVLVVEDVKVDCNGSIGRKARQAFTPAFPRGSHCVQFVSLTRITRLQEVQNDTLDVERAPESFSRVLNDHYGRLPGN